MSEAGPGNYTAPSHYVGRMQAEAVGSRASTDKQVEIPKSGNVAQESKDFEPALLSGVVKNLPRSYILTLFYSFVYTAGFLDR